MSVSALPASVAVLSRETGVASVIEPSGAPVIVASGATLVTVMVEETETAPPSSSVTTQVATKLPLSLGVKLKAAASELQDHGYQIPDYPDEPSSEDEREVRARYELVKGSAVNPVLRQGNSDRRAPPSVKEYARRHPHSMGTWSRESRSHVATMTNGDFRSTEQSVTVESGGTIVSGMELDNIVESVATAVTGLLLPVEIRLRALPVRAVALPIAYQPAHIGFSRRALPLTHHPHD